MTVQEGLFGPIVEAPRKRSRWERRTDDFPRRTTANPSGDYVLKRDYAIDPQWNPETLKAAEALVKQLFDKVGGIRVLNDKVMRAVLGAFIACTVVEIQRAIDVKGKQVARHPEFKFLPRPENFFDPNRIAGLLRLSDEHRDAQRRKQRALNAPERERQAQRQAEYERRLEAQANAQAAQTKADRAAKLRLSEQYEQKLTARREAFWQRLTEEQRAEALEFCGGLEEAKRWAMIRWLKEVEE